MTKFVPKSRPRMSYGDLRSKVEAMGLDFTKHPLVIVGVRGYYKNSMGVPDKNDTGIYDDALFIMSPNQLSAFNANTDPSKRRPGYGFDRKTRGMARLQNGVWLAYKFAVHVGKSSQYEAICQRAGSVKVMRDGNPDYPHEGKDFGINIHKGGWKGTSSEGCQTIYPTQWPEFITTAQSQAQRLFGSKWRSTVIPYVLMDNHWD